MSDCRLSVLAELDLADIADYTTEVWGPKQAYVYLGSLEECFARIARSPDLGCACEPIYPGSRRIEQGKHVIFYRSEENGIIIGRILH